MTTSTFSRPATIEERVCRIVRHGADVAHAEAERGGEEVREADPEIRRARRGRRADPRGRNGKIGREARGRSRTSSGNRDEEDEALRAAPEPQVTGAGNRPTTARHNRTRVPDCVRSTVRGAHEALVYHSDCPPQRPTPRPGTPASARIQLRGRHAGRPLEDQRDGSGEQRREQNDSRAGVPPDVRGFGTGAQRLDLTAVEARRTQSERPRAPRRSRCRCSARRPAARRPRDETSAPAADDR